MAVALPPLPPSLLPVPSCWRPRNRRNRPLRCRKRWSHRRLCHRSCHHPTNLVHQHHPRRQTQGPPPLAVAEPPAPPAPPVRRATSVVPLVPPSPPAMLFDEVAPPEPPAPLSRPLAPPLPPWPPVPRVITSGVSSRVATHTTSGSTAAIVGFAAQTSGATHCVATHRNARAPPPAPPIPRRRSPDGAPPSPAPPPAPPMACHQMVRVSAGAARTFSGAVAASPLAAVKPH